MDTKYLIRRASKEDAPALAEILTKSWMSAYADILPPAELKSSADKERYAAIFSTMTNHPENHFFLALCGDRPCGMALYSPARDADLPDYAELIAVYTLQEHWGTGLGQTLMEKVLKELIGVYNDVALWVFQDNTRARRFYEKFGFAPDGKQKQENFSDKPQSLRYIKVFKP